MMALNVLLNNLYQLFWLNFVIYIAQWLTFQAYKPQITSSNPPGTFVHINSTKILKIKFFYQNCISVRLFFFTLILLMHHAIFHNEVIYC